MKNLFKAAATVIALSTIYVAPASAVVILFGPDSTATGGGVISFPLGVPTGIVGDAVLSVTVQGDLNDGSFEHFETLIDGVSLGTASGGAGPDTFPAIPDSYLGFIGLNSNVYSDSVVISNAIIAPLLADGILSIAFDLAPEVNATFTPDPGGTFSALPPGGVFYVQGSLTFTEASNVPEPGVIALLGLGLAGMSLHRRARRATAKSKRR